MYLYGVIIIFPSIFLYYFIVAQAPIYFNFIICSNNHKILITYMFPQIKIYNRCYVNNTFGLMEIKYQLI